MRINVAIATVGLMTLGALSAGAQELTAVITPNPFVVPSLPAVVNWDAVITNTSGADTVDFNNASLGALPFDASTTTDYVTQLLSNTALGLYTPPGYTVDGTDGGIDLAPGQSITFSGSGFDPTNYPHAFTLSLDPGLSSAFIGDLFVSGTDKSTGLTVSDNPAGCGPGNSGNVACPDPLATYIDAGNPFGNFASTPEPGSASLFASCVLCSSAILLRRRRK
jgi:hypothetical protein